MPIPSNRPRAPGHLRRAGHRGPRHAKALVFSVADGTGTSPALVATVRARARCRMAWITDIEAVVQNCHVAPSRPWLIYRRPARRLWGWPGELVKGMSTSR